MRTTQSSSNLKSTSGVEQTKLDASIEDDLRWVEDNVPATLAETY